MTGWSWAALGVFVGAAAFPSLTRRRTSVRAQNARIAAVVVARSTLVAVLVWGVVRLVQHGGALHYALAACVAVVAVIPAVWALLGIHALFDSPQVEETAGD
jgi:hypothetical protein